MTNSLNRQLLAFAVFVVLPTTTFAADTNSTRQVGTPECVSRVGGVGPYGPHRPAPVPIPNDEKLGKIFLDQVMENSSADPTGHVVPLMNTRRCGTNNDGYLRNCGAVGQDIPVSEISVDQIPVATFVRVEATPVHSCVARYSSGSLPITVRLSGEAGAEETTTMYLRYGEPQRVPFLLDGEARLGRSQWATGVRIEVNPGSWERIPSSCQVTLRVWPNYPRMEVEDADNLLERLDEEVAYKDRMLDYAQVVVSASAAFELVTNQLNFLLGQLATGAEEELRESSSAMVDALEELLLVALTMPDPDEGISAETETAVLDLIDILQGISDGQSWQSPDGSPLTIQDVLGEEDASFLSEFTNRLDELEEQARQDVEGLPVELADLREALAQANELLRTRIYERAAPPWDRVLAIPGRVRVTGSSFFSFLLLQQGHEYAITLASGIGLKDRLTPIQSEIYHCAGATLRVCGTAEGNGFAPVSYDILDVGGGVVPVVGIVGEVPGGFSVTANNGEVVVLFFSTASRQERFGERVGTGAKVWIHGRFLADGSLKVLRYGIVRPAD